MFFIDFDPFLFFLIGFDCFELDRGRCGWDRVWRALIRTNSYLLRFCQHERGQNLARSEVSNAKRSTVARFRWQSCREGSVNQGEGLVDGNPWMPSGMKRGRFNHWRSRSFVESCSTLCAASRGDMRCDFGTYIGPSCDLCYTFSFWCARSTFGARLFSRETWAASCGEFPAGGRKLNIVRNTPRSVSL